MAFRARQYLPSEATRSCQRTAEVVPILVTVKTLVPTLEVSHLSQADRPSNLLHARSERSGARQLHERLGGFSHALKLR